ncbi:hypothetical protein [Chryseobacterium indoltheticum]|uniref:Uncharacterized protein n=1 Tax=Chryseobacterium indoltheticum TaxID=254 RepID=A0A381F4A8_9FLAO|nr:hypothetical protein [Chryseobacterium indoltheticum]AZA74941.1 hypothetical protein EG358_14720 [Chryseobacterium indoltheticum]SIQ29597.1 hypothetical protein SAMN05421682_10413 [Chryseobacterium indoltheticum]SUX41391.1 Uncharacterised protein [Chryseobacterium indoltheticum]
MNFRVFNKEGAVIPLNLDLNADYWALGDKDAAFNFMCNPSKNGIMWDHNDEEIILEDENADLKGYPTANLKNVVVIYLGINGKHKPPHNCVIYNLDGSIHKILEIPSLKSPLAIKRMEFLKEENPPLDTALYEGALCFSGFSVIKLNTGEIVNSIAIDYDRELWETRILNPETGEIGDLIYYGKN